MCIFMSGTVTFVRKNDCSAACGRRWMQGGSHPLLYACIRDGAAIASLEVLLIRRLDRSPAGILAFSTTLRHLVLPDLTLRGARELTSVVAALTLLQASASWLLPLPNLRHSLLGRMKTNFRSELFRIMPSCLMQHSMIYAV